jgi:glycerate kinase
MSVLDTPHRPQLRALVCPDSFKGTHDAFTVAHHIGQGLREGGVSPDFVPLADGGEGTAEALLHALGGQRLSAEVRGPSGEKVVARFVMLANLTAVVEVAAAAGLDRSPAHPRGPIEATTHGVGDLILAASDAGADHVLVAAGGSCTSDGGAGANTVLDTRTSRLPALTILCDTTTPFEQAAAVFAPQKGATPAQVQQLTASLASVAATLPRDPTGIRYSGSAGGLAGGLWARGRASLRSGSAFVLDTVSIDSRIRQADLVVTGEGQVDSQSLDGKLVGAVARRAQLLGRPLALVVGRDALTPLLRSRLNAASIIQAGDLEGFVAAGRLLAHDLRRVAATAHPPNQPIHAGVIGISEESP